ncbi:hypothetical protein [Dyadobacter sp. 32]|uniref:hypothetical protein n=1 Tax=Dyadobacter sp. 32 TaxID=538966 RepID=UPI0011ED4817
MSTQGKTITATALTMILSLFLSSCNKQDDRNKSVNYYKQEKDVRFKSSIAIVGDSTYYNVYKNAGDSITNWIDNEIQFFERFKIDSCKLDSLVCFNSEGDKAIMARLAQCRRDCTQDDIHFFYGVKIKKQWYFFSGSTIIIIREAYGYPKHTPLPFTKLHEIAMDNIFKGYLKKNKESGKWEINDNFFARFYERDAYNYPFTTQEAWEESWLKLMRENWEKRDTTNYKPLQ